MRENTRIHIELLVSTGAGLGVFGTLTITGGELVPSI